jgi:hypothetical protein
MWKSNSHVLTFLGALQKPFTYAMMPSTGLRVNWGCVPVSGAFRKYDDAMWAGKFQFGWYKRTNDIRFAPRIYETVDLSKTASSDDIMSWEAELEGRTRALGPQRPSGPGDRGKLAWITDGLRFQSSVNPSRWQRLFWSS